MATTISALIWHVDNCSYSTVLLNYKVWQKLVMFLSKMIARDARPNPPIWLTYSKFTCQIRAFYSESDFVVLLIQKHKKSSRYKSRVRQVGFEGRFDCCRSLAVTCMLAQTPCVGLSAFIRAIPQHLKGSVFKSLPYNFHSPLIRDLYMIWHQTALETRGLGRYL